LFDDTVIVFYGDHDAKLNTKEYNYLYNYDPVTGVLKEEGDEGYIEYDYYANELNRKTPLIIWSKDKKYKGEVNYYMGMIDVLPTLGNMFGFESKYALGHDIFDIKNKTYEKLPDELKKRLNEYQIETVIHEHCDNHRISQLIKRYNNHTSMNTNQKAFTHIDNYARNIREILDKKFFND